MERIRGFGETRIRSDHSSSAPARLSARPRRYTHQARLLGVERAPAELVSDLDQPRSVRRLLRGDLRALVRRIHRPAAVLLDGLGRELRLVAHEERRRVSDRRRREVEIVLLVWAGEELRRSVLLDRVTEERDFLQVV